jgi:phosphatidylglycerol lysyltransferase
VSVSSSLAQRLPSRPALIRIALVVALVALVGTIAWRALSHMMRDFRAEDAAAALAAIPPHHIFGAVLLTIASYVLLTFYDMLAQRIVGVRAPLGLTMRAAFTSYALSHTLGFGAITGGSARLRIYGTIGIAPAKVARIIVIAGVSFWIGVGIGAGVALAALTAPLDLGVMVIIPVVAHVAGALILGLVVLLAAITALRPDLLKPLRPMIGTLNARTVLALAIVSTVDLACAALALYLLLPHEQWHFARFMLAYAMGITLGLVTHIPGGLGVFEAVILATLPDEAADAGVAALIAYRVIYYVLPFSLALVLNGAIEAIGVAPLLRRLTAPLRRVALDASPVLFGAMSFAGGLVLLLSGALPAEHDRIRSLVLLLPLPFIETSHLAASLVGTALLLVAPALTVRLASGMRTARALFVLGALFSLAKGLDFEEATVMLVMAGLLQMAAPAFYRGRTGAFSTHNLRWLAAAAVAVAITCASGAVFYDADHFRSDLWWHFALYGDGPRFLRASFGTGIVLTAFALREWMTQPRASGGAVDVPVEVIRRAMAACPRSDANLAHTGDKRFLVSPEGDAFLMFRPQGRTWVVMGDPVGPRERWSALIWELRRLAHLSNAPLCFYQASEAMLPLMVDLGLAVMKYGEEAIVDPRSFTLEGPRMKGLRNSRARALREGLALTLVSPGHVPEWMPRLKPISDQWLALQHGAEKGFSLGHFDAAYLANFELAVVMRGDEVMAFANLWMSGDGTEMSVDLMRQHSESPPGTMDLMFTELIALAAQRGCRRFNLGLAPLAGVTGGRLAPFWARLARGVYHVGGSVYNFAGLYFYKQKFAPTWESRYIACPQGPRGFFAVGAVVSLVSGGRG